MIHSYCHGALFIAGLLCALSGGTAGAAEVSSDRLRDAASEPQNWLMANRTYDGHRYSPLDVINKDNVGQLKLLYSLPIYALRTEDTQTGGNYRNAQQSSPLVDDGNMYLVDGWGRVYRIDLRTHKIVWVTETGQDNIDSWTEAKRGLSLYKNFVIAIAPDGKLHWIDTETGKLMNSVTVDDPASGYTITAPPLVADDMLIVGGAGGDRGARVHIDGLDATTGKPVWRTYAVPDDAGPNAGGSFLQTGVYDASAGLTVWGVGAPLPPYAPAGQDGADNDTNSALALDVRTGAIKWRFPFTPGGDPGFSEAGSYLMIDTDVDGVSRQLVARFAANGFYYNLDRNDGSFVSATPYVQSINWTTGIDPHTGAPLLSAVAHTPLSRQFASCPNIRGVPLALATYSDKTRLAYGSGADDCVQPGPIGTAGNDTTWPGAQYADANEVGGLLAAVDPATGKKIATHRFDAPVHAGAFSTAGGLVFVTTADGVLSALDDKTLETVWSQQFSTLSSVPPITFGMDGKQYIAVVIGGNAFAESLAYRPDTMMHAQPYFVLAILGFVEP